MTKTFHHQGPDQCFKWTRRSAGADDFSTVNMFLDRAELKLDKDPTKKKKIKKQELK